MQYGARQLGCTKVQVHSYPDEPSHGARCSSAPVVTRARACVLSRLRRRVGLVVVREMARHRLRRVPYIGVPRHIVEERMQPFQLRAIERGGGAAVSAADFYAFQQRQGAWGRDAA